MKAKIIYLKTLAIFCCFLVNQNSYSQIFDTFKSNTQQQRNGFEKEKNILILHSYHQGLEWSDNISKGYLEVFNDRNDINHFFEYLDIKRNSDPEYSEALLNLYAIKDRKTHFDVIVTVDDAAFNFMLENGQRFYPGIPVVFCGVNKVNPVLLDGHNNFIGIEENADHFGTLSSVGEIFPKRNNVLVINDNTLTGNANLNELYHFICYSAQ